MLLSDSLFQEICGICILDWKNDGTERREHPRVDLARRATLMPWIQNLPGPSRVVIIRDMSVKGVALLQSEEADIGDEFVLDVTKFVGHPLGIRCSVERIEPGGSGGTQFVVGATFSSLIESAELLIPAPQPVDELEVQPAGAWRAMLSCLAKLPALPNWCWMKLSRHLMAIFAKRRPS